MRPLTCSCPRSRAWVEARKTPTLPMAPAPPAVPESTRPASLGTVLRGIPPRDERAHAVADEDDGQARLLLAGLVGHGVQVVDDRLPPVALGEGATRARRLAVAPVVRAVDGIPVVGEALRETGVAARVLGEAVRDLDDRPRVTVGKPPVDEDVGAVGRGQRERAALHGSSSICSVTGRRAAAYAVRRVAGSACSRDGSEAARWSPHGGSGVGSAVPVCPFRRRCAIKTTETGARIYLLHAGPVVSLGDEPQRAR